MVMKTLNLLGDAVHLAADCKAQPVFGFGHDYGKYLAEFCTENEPGRLVCLYETKDDWAAWESHPAGDELVVVISGRAEFLQEVGGEVRRSILGAHQAIINPAGVWHTANVIEPFVALFVTPGPGTSHRPR
jgi:quercetin dioxygenase-like cupin family protein